jgi:hypothetical protein
MQVKQEQQEQQEQQQQTTEPATVEELASLTSNLP